MDQYFKKFPPGLGHIKVPTSSRAAAIAALALYAPCRPRAVWMHRTAFFLLRRFGARVLPGRATRWLPPMEAEVWDDLCATWQRELVGFDEIVVAERSQLKRSGLAVLLLEKGSPRAFVKVRRNGREALEAERRIVERIWDAQLQHVEVPEPLGTGVSHDWNYLASAPLPSPAHWVPHRPPIREIAAEITSALRLPRDLDTPVHWQPMHGDMTPWNLREMPDGRLLLFDWEDAGWGPPGADEVLYRATAAAIRSPVPGGATPGEEAIAFWQARVRSRAGIGKRDRALEADLLRALDQLLGEAESPGVAAGAG